MKVLQRVIISRTDSIGDVVLTLPVAGMMKKKYPDTEILFLGRSYTADVIDACEHVDRFVNWDEIDASDDATALKLMKDLNADAIIHVFPRPAIARLAKQAGIPERVGTRGRLYHWTTCNKLVRISRRRSPWHEAQLNLMLISNLSGETLIPVEEIPSLYGLSRVKEPDERHSDMIDHNRFNLILHPGSKGSAREWGLNNFIGLCDSLPEEGYNIFVSGSEEEGRQLRDTGIFDRQHVSDITGQMTLAQFMGFIAQCDGLVAASTGPLHLAAALGRIALGIYPPIKPMHPGRWAPLGEKATYLVKDKDCDKCRKKGPCECMLEISPEAVKNRIIKMS